jgi:isocitrate dehydrogenase
MTAVLRQKDKLMASNAMFVSDDGMEIEANEAADRTLGAFGLAFQRDFEGTATTPVGSCSRSVNVPVQRRSDLYLRLRPSDTHPTIPSLCRDADIIVERADRIRRELELGGLRNA